MSILRSTRMRPGRGDITKMRSARNTASRRSCVTRMTVMPARGMQVADHAPQFLAREGVERAERLVQHQQLRLVDQRAAQRGALLHAAGQLPGIFAAEAAEPDRGEQVLGARDIFRLVAADLAAMRLHDLQRQQQVFERGAPGQQRRRLERHAGDLDRLGDLLRRRRAHDPRTGIAGRSRASSAWTCRSRTVRPPRRIRRG